MSEILAYKLPISIIKTYTQQYLAAFGIALLSSAISLPTPAQIAADGTLPTQVNTLDELNTIWEITGGGETGNNLFHSFAEFSVLTGNEVWFNNAEGVQNIINRVTGGSISTIDGLIRANGNANLFLLNPNGIIFGPNATLDVGGSFVASTAQTIRFADGTDFSTTDTQTAPLLTISIPLGLQFGSNPAGIQVQGSLLPGSQSLIPPGKSFALVGGDITLEGAALVAPDGRVELGSFGSNSFVSLSNTSQGFALGTENIANWGNIQLQQSLVDVSGFDGGGEIYFWGQDITINDSGVLVIPSPDATQDGGGIFIQAQNQLTIGDGSAIQTVTSSSALGGEIDLEAHQINIQNGLILSPSELIPTLVSTETQSSGTGGNLTLRANNVEILNASLVGTGTGGTGTAGDFLTETNTLLVADSQILASTTAEGNGGELVVNASESVEIMGTVPILNLPSSLLTETNSIGEAGNLVVNTGNLMVRDGGQISASTFAAGNASDVTINATEIELRGIANTGIISGLFSQIEPGDTGNATGNGGNITINTDNLRILDGAQVSSSTQSTGNAGSLLINASSFIAIEGASNNIGSSLFAQVDSGATGAGGDIAIETSQLTLEGNLARISTTTLGFGTGGNVNIAAEELFVLDGAQIQAATIGLAPGGTLTLNASDLVQLIGTSSVDSNLTSGLFTSTDTLGNAPAGNLIVNTSNLIIQDGARISASTLNQGQGGTISINATDAVELIGITSDSQSPSGLFVEAIGAGDAGNIALSATSLYLRDGAQISAASQGEGQGGTIDLQIADDVEVTGTAGLFVDSSLFVAATGTGQAGNVNLRANSLLLDSQGAVIAETTTDNGGNISLDVEDRIILRRNSLISATAGTVSGSGNGGNIAIETNYLIAIPEENSDITANAFAGRGGNINITSQGLFGLEFRNQPTPLSDITASSQLGVDGVVAINTPEINPSDGLIALTANTVDVTNLIAQGCNSGGESASNRLFITGRGGLPALPSRYINQGDSLVDLGNSRPLIPTQQQLQTNEPQNTNTTPAQIVEATGWFINAAGNVVLSAQPNNTTNHLSTITASCQP